MIITENSVTYNKQAYDNQTTCNINTAVNAINNGRNVIICGPEHSGKSFIRNKVKHLIDDYDVYFGTQEYHYRNRSNGRHYNENKFWIEEINNDLLVNVLEDYEFISTPIQFNR